MVCPNDGKVLHPDMKMFAFGWEPGRAIIVAMPSARAMSSLRDRLFGKGALAPGHHPDLHTMPHAVMARRALHGFYRRMALSRLVVALLWTVFMTVPPHAPGRVGDLVGASVVAGVAAMVSAVAAWVHHHDGVLEWMRDRAVLGWMSSYLRRTARERRVSVDVPGAAEGASVLALTALTAWAAPSAGEVASVEWSLAFTLLLLYFPFSQYVIDPAWYQPDLARRAGFAWFRFLLPLALAGAGLVLYRVCAPTASVGPDGAVVIAGLMMRLYVDVSLVNSLLAALPSSLRDQRKDLSDAVSSALHSKIKNQLRLLSHQLDLDSQSAEVRASWHRLMHQVESLRRHPFREDGGVDIDDILEGVKSTCGSLVHDRSAIEVSVERSPEGGSPLRPTDLSLLEIVLGDLCGNAVREANRQGGPMFKIRVSVSTTREGSRRRVTVVVKDDGRGFDAAAPLSRMDSSLAVLDRRLRRRGGGLDFSRSSSGGAQVRATWLAL